MIANCLEMPPEEDYAINFVEQEGGIVYYELLLENQPNNSEK